MSFYTPSMVFRSCMFSEIDVFTNFILLFRSYLSVSTCTSRVHDRCELFNTAEFIPLSIVSRRLFHLETLDKNWGGEGVGNTGAMAARLGKFNLVTETGVERAGRKKWNRGVSDNAVGQRCFASIVARTASVSNKGWRTKQVRQVEGCDWQGMRTGFGKLCFPTTLFPFFFFLYSGRCWGTVIRNHRVNGCVLDHFESK